LFYIFRYSFCVETTSVSPSTAPMGFWQSWIVVLNLKLPRGCMKDSTQFSNIFRWQL
jgi:hypothetical protein